MTDKGVYFPIQYGLLGDRERAKVPLIMRDGGGGGEKWQKLIG